MEEKMSKEDMIKEALEEARSKVAEEVAAKEADQPNPDVLPEEGVEKAPYAKCQEENTEDTQQEDTQQEDTKGDEQEESKDKKENSGEKKKIGRKSKKDKKDEKIEELTDRLTRQMAEFDNFRKRTDKEKSLMYEIGARDIIEKILPVVDNFERGLAAVPEEEKATPFAEGLEKIYKQLIVALEEIGVKSIEAIGSEFNPEYHNAVMHVEDDALGENMIAEEFQKGYTYRDSVVRHSMVKVAN